MAKSKRSSLKADPFYLKAFRVRASSDVSRKSIEVPPSTDGTTTAIEDSPAQERATIKLVQPSPPQTSASTVESRSVSAGSQNQETVMAKAPTSSPMKQEGNEGKLNATPNKHNTSDHSDPAKALPIFEQFTPSRNPTNHEQILQPIMGSPTLSPSGTFTSRAPSPGSDDGSHLPPHLRSSGSIGKSGRVIERMSSENSRLQRELNEKTARLEEAQRTHETDRIAIQEAKESAMRHQHMYETNEAILIRRDRKVEELKEALAKEKARRERAENERQDMAQVLQTETTNATKQLAIEQEKRLFYQSQYEILEQAWSKKRMPWQPTVDRLREEMDKVEAMLHRLAVNQEHITTHQAKAEEIHQQYVDKFEEYKAAKHDLLGPLAEKIKKNEDAADDLLEEMEATLHKMRWVIAVKRDVKDAQ